MSNKKLMKKVLVISLSATMVIAIGSSVYASTQALPNGTIVNQNGTNYLTDSNGQKYSGWFKDSNEDWYYFNESDKSMKIGWHHDDKDGYWYYLNFSDGKMATGWQTIDGKEYFFQPVRDMGNYNFNNEQEKWLYSINSRVPYGAMYVNTTTPDGSKVDDTGAKVVTAETDNNSNQDTDTKTVKTGWVSQNGKWYYYESDVMAKNKWLNLSGKWYYVTGDGVMVSNGWKEIDGKSYYFGSDGAMCVNTTTPDGKKVGNDGSMIDGNSLNYSDFVGTYYSDGEYVQCAVTITKIEGGLIYGTLEVKAPDDYYYSDFRNGVEINKNIFTVQGVDDDGSHNLPTTWKLVYDNGKPVLWHEGISGYIPKSQKIESNKKAILTMCVGQYDQYYETGINIFITDISNDMVRGYIGYDANNIIFDFRKGLTLTDDMTFTIKAESSIIQDITAGNMQNQTKVTGSFKVGSDGASSIVLGNNLFIKMGR